MARRLRGGWTDAWIEDVAQEVALRVVRGAPGCRARSEAGFQRWVLGIIRREVAELHRSEGPHARAGGNGPDPASPEPLEDHAPPSPERRWLRAALEQADGELHELLWRRLVAGESWKEVGDALGISASAAKRRLQRFLARVRRASEAGGTLVVRADVRYERLPGGTWTMLAILFAFGLVKLSGRPIFPTRRPLRFVAST